jgi:hypothetical protein
MALPQDQVPVQLSGLAYDARRKVPVPYMNVLSDGTVDFSGISAAAVIECGRDRLCGICHQPLTYWIAFVGGPLSTANRAYTDPPFHRGCAEFAMEHCPHIKVRNHRRTPEDRLADDTWVSPDGKWEKPDQWIIGLTRDYQMVAHRGGLLFRTAPIKDTLVYEYNDDNILERKS